MKTKTKITTGALAALTLVALLAAGVAVRAADDKAASAAPKPALTVTVTQPQRAALPLVVAANGSIAAWQEASVGAESNGWRIAEVRVNVGDSVKRGQVLATFAAEMAQADLAQIKAAVAEAEATAAEAAANAQRARELQASGALSAQQINQYLTAERTAQARLEAQRAAARVQELRLAQTQVLAPDNGVISARSATVGAVVPAGQELFRLIRQGRLEWRAEVPAADLASLKAGQTVRVTPAANGAKAGMFARGEFDIGSGNGLTLPQTAVLLRDGFSYIFAVGSDAKVKQVKVNVGRRVGDRIELTTALDASARVVVSGGGFLADGDTVRVVEAKVAAAK
ncbi:MAG: efflux RND transporter periplasmic adaptor subunit [Bacteroidia bacterium]|jgi:multidrug efflux pump subunit AcrA (membrane-fusion protein)